MLSFWYVCCCFWSSVRVCSYFCFAVSNRVTLSIMLIKVQTSCIRPYSAFYRPSRQNYMPLIVLPYYAPLWFVLRPRRPRGPTSS